MVSVTGPEGASLAFAVKRTETRRKMISEKTMILAKIVACVVARSNMYPSILKFDSHETHEGNPHESGYDKSDAKSSEWSRDI